MMPGIISEKIAPTAFSYRSLIASLPSFKRLADCGKSIAAILLVGISAMFVTLIAAS